MYLRQSTQLHKNVFGRVVVKPLISASYVLLLPPDARLRVLGGLLHLSNIPDRPIRHMKGVCKIVAFPSVTFTLAKISCKFGLYQR